MDNLAATILKQSMDILEMIATPDPDQTSDGVLFEIASAGFNPSEASTDMLFG